MHRHASAVVFCSDTTHTCVQDRCHRIGQTKDVHIYRLISQHTVEENILRKSNQKRHLDHLAIQSAGFTTAALNGGGESVSGGLAPGELTSGA